MTARSGDVRTRFGSPLLLFAVLALASGCGDEDGSGAAATEDGGGSGSASTGGRSDTGGASTTGGTTGSGGLSANGGSAGSATGGAGGGAAGMTSLDGGEDPGLGPCTDDPEGVDVIELARSGGVVAYRVEYPSTDGTRVQGQICVPEAPGPHPIVVYNHGGVQGLSVGQWGPIPNNNCHSTAASGSIAVFAQYRGTRDQGQNAMLGSIDFASEGVVEFCEGEVDDVLELVTIARRRCDAMPDRIAMYGDSHGGCITLRAASRHPPGLRAAAALVAPVDLVTGYEYNVARAPDGSESPAPGCDPVADHQYISAGFAALFGTPDTNPTGYADRSAIHRVAELVDVPLLFIWGVSDCLIDVATQGCVMHDALAGAGVEVIAHHLDSQGQPTTSPLPGCGDMSFQPTWTGDFSGDHYVIFGDAQGHQLEGPARQKEFDAIRSFFLQHASDD